MGEATTITKAAPLMSKRDAVAFVRRMDRLMAGDVREAVACVREGPDALLSEVGAENVADAIARGLKVLEAASTRSDEEAIEYLARRARKYVNGIVRESRKAKDPAHLAMLVYQLVSGEPAMRRAIA